MIWVCQLLPHLLLWPILTKITIISTGSGDIYRETERSRYIGGWVDGQTGRQTWTYPSLLKMRTLGVWHYGVPAIRMLVTVVAKDESSLLRRRRRQESTESLHQATDAGDRSQGVAGR